MRGFRAYVKRNGGEHARRLARTAGYINIWREMREFVTDMRLPHPLANEIEDLFDGYREARRRKEMDRT